MDLIIAICLVFLFGLFVGGFLGIASVCLCRTAKSPDETEHECNAPYPRIHE
jgi:hypothetical protein